ncbi:ricin-type beta-trefoil lectin domain protein [Streptomyces alboflavus]|uniref:ricin-type beta-trefoil lectin domain protein n=1 Tax=Streptomyces alboflavus TaxID=67267 RepID=UPI0004C04F37|nr:ricin-type beta-trefoil lectin domain protein [Streptomyces alboflavus]
MSKRKFVSAALSVLGAGALVTVATAPGAAAVGDSVRAGSIVNEGTGRCLNVAGGGVVKLADCRGGDAQTWTIRQDRRIESARGQCIGVAQDNTVRLEDCASAPLWSGMEVRELRAFGGCLMPDFADSSRLTFGFPGGPNQKWQLPN